MFIEMPEDWSLRRAIGYNSPLPLGKYLTNIPPRAAGLEGVPLGVRASEPSGPTTVPCFFPVDFPSRMRGVIVWE
jgi:hypothetical protein